MFLGSGHDVPGRFGESDVVAAIKRIER